jgi:hypothetical protein
MRNYRDLFEQEFSGCSRRLFDLPGSGLNLGIKTLTMEEAFNLLTCNKQEVNIKYDVNSAPNAEKLRDFALMEVNRLETLRGILTGEARMDYNSLANHIDECDYLWAHFPDYAASSRRPDKTELESGNQTAVSFLNRLRVEIDPILKLWYNTVSCIKRLKI